MSSSLPVVASSQARDPHHSPAAQAAPSRPSSPPQPGRWWYVFDRWLAVADVADEQDEFVMA